MLASISASFQVGSRADWEKNWNHVINKYKRLVLVQVLISDDGLVGESVPKWAEAATHNHDWPQKILIGTSPVFVNIKDFLGLILGVLTLVPHWHTDQTLIPLHTLWLLLRLWLCKEAPTKYGRGYILVILESFLLQEVLTWLVFFGLSLLHTSSVSFVTASH